MRLFHLSIAYLTLLPWGPERPRSARGHDRVLVQAVPRSFGNRVNLMRQRPAS